MAEYFSTWENLKPRVNFALRKSPSLPTPALGLVNRNTGFGWQYLDKLSMLKHRATETTALAEEGCPHLPRQTQIPTARNLAWIRGLGWRYREVRQAVHPLVRHRRSRERTALRRRPLVSRPAGDQGSCRFHRWPPGVVSPGR